MRIMNESDYAEGGYIPQGSIYKYTGVAGALAILRNTSFKFTSPLDFNDPFDCDTSILEFTRTADSVAEYKQALELSNLPLLEKMRALAEFYQPATFQKVYAHVAKHKIETAKVTCFSKTHSNTLMWSHYAQNHKGICLEFNGSMPANDVLERGTAFMVNVNYDRVGMIDYNLDKERAIVDLFTRKWSDWRYEEEVRIIIMDEEPIQKFDKSFLTGIIFGCRTPDSDKQEVLRLLSKGGYEVPVWCAVRGKFKLEFQPVLF